MRVIPLGIGGWVSNPLLGNVALIVEVGNSRILIDAGEGTYRALRACGFDVDNLDLILITHRHGDHIMGLSTLALFARSKGIALKVYGPRDVDLEKLFDALGIPQYLPTIDFHPIDPSPEPLTVAIGHDYKITAILADHTVQTLAYRIDGLDGTCITYSSDTRPTKNIVNLARGCTLLVHEASGNPGTEEVSHLHGHSTTTEAIQIAREAGVKYLMPIHYYVEPPILSNVGSDVNIIIPLPCTPLDMQKLK
ncbi:MBL fold metallo-hydrolase [Vulcanisaeta sp. JCM 16161]|uniref:MBL fold metallo-hydrolase n=1 Tax=Vulcanisaeta sp. JCM 16161 TaxID=1295372 RepID=UPI0006CFF870|nr:MBL fold metallo-hydrolase [Vulcanisaeta sp. JCM 16161]